MRLENIKTKIGGGYLLFLLGLVAGFAVDRAVFTRTSSEPQETSMVLRRIAPRQDRGKQASSLIISSMSMDDVVRQDYRLADENYQKAILGLLASDVPSTRRDETIANYLKEWAKFDFPAAIAFSDKSLQARFFQLAALDGWAMQNPTAALAWLKGKRTNDFYDIKELGIVLNRLAVSDPQRFIDEADDLPYEAVQLGMSNVVDQFIASGNIEKVNHWAAGLSENDILKRDIYATLMTSWGSRNLDDVRTVLGDIESTKVRQYAIQALVSSAVAIDGEKVLNWADDSFPDEAERAKITGMILSSWSGYDLNNYSRWLTSLDKNLVTDPMIYHLAIESTKSDSLYALGWVEKIKDEGMKESLTRNILSELSPDRLAILRKETTDKSTIKILNEN